MDYLQRQIQDFLHKGLLAHSSLFLPILITNPTKGFKMLAPEGGEVLNPTVSLPLRFLYRSRWVAPSDETAQTIDSEFLVGNDLLVAPVLEKGAMSRDIYLPAGRWRSQTRAEVLDGGMWHKDYPAKLDELPWFTRVQENKPKESKPEENKPEEVVEA